MCSHGKVTKESGYIRHDFPVYFFGMNDGNQDKKKTPGLKCQVPSPKTCIKSLLDLELEICLPDCISRQGILDLINVLIISFAVQIVWN